MFFFNTLSRHLPIGVLYDYYASDSMLPWNITVHFQVCNNRNNFQQFKAIALKLGLRVELSQLLHDNAAS